jgi:hypothetical protein
MRRLIFVLTLLAAAALASPSLAATEKPPPEQQPPEFTNDPGFSAVGQAEEVEARRGRDPMMPCCDATHCWSTTTTRSRGLWPYGRAIHLYTLWCSQGGIINYRDSSAWPSVDFLCGSSDLWWGKVGGGAGWPFVDVQAQAAFACHSPWWFDWNDFLMQRIRYHPGGWYETIAYQ